MGEMILVAVHGVIQAHKANLTGINVYSWKQTAEKKKDCLVFSGVDFNFSSPSLLGRGIPYLDNSIGRGHVKHHTRTICTFHVPSIIFSYSTDKLIAFFHGLFRERDLDTSFG
jgi:hypothetical protein